MSTEKFLTIKQAAEKIGLKPWWIHRAIRQNLIPFYKFQTGRNLVLESEIRACIERSRSGSAH